MSVVFGVRDADRVANRRSLHVRGMSKMRVVSARVRRREICVWAGKHGKAGERPSSHVIQVLDKIVQRRFEGCNFS